MRLQVVVTDLRLPLDLFLLVVCLVTTAAGVRLREIMEHGRFHFRLSGVGTGCLLQVGAGAHVLHVCDARVNLQDGVLYWAL